MAFRSPADRVFNPAIDRRLAPACAMHTDPYLARECALGDLAVHRRARQSCAIENGPEANDSVGCVCHETCLHRMVLSGTP